MSDSFNVEVIDQRREMTYDLSVNLTVQSILPKFKLFTQIAAIGPKYIMVN